MAEEEKRDVARDSKADRELTLDDKSVVKGSAAAAAYRKQTEPEGGDRAARAEEEAKAGSSPAAEEAERRIAELKDMLQRKAAEFDNYRKRVEREREEFVAYATARLIEELLPVLDNFRLALDADPALDPEAYKSGVQMILKQIDEVLARRGLRAIEAVGEQFDPHFHEAITHEPSTEHEEGEVIAALQRGYTLGGRVLRPARVRVATAAGEEEGGRRDDGPEEIPIQ